MFDKFGFKFDANIRAILFVAKFYDKKMIAINIV